MVLTVRKFEAQGFRSLQAIAYPMSTLDVFVGPNGVGKTNLYRALELLQSAARNTLAHDLARQGGLASALWAGKRRRSDPVRLRLAVDLAEPASARRAGPVYRYEVEVGFPPRAASAAFQAEPQIKTEAVSLVGGSRTGRLIDRRGSAVMGRTEGGRPEEIDIDLLDSETVLGRLEDPSPGPSDWRALAWRSRTFRSASSSRRSCRTGPCAISPWPARCSPTACHRSSP